MTAPSYDAGECRICHGPAKHQATHLCDRCWELERRIHADRALAVQIVSEFSTLAPAEPSAERLVLQHRTTGSYLREDNSLTRDIREADTFATRTGAEVIWESLEDFQAAWEIVPCIGTDWPLEFPGAWQHWPADLRKITARLLVERHLAEFGPGDLVKHVVTFQWRRGNVGSALPYGARAEKFWTPFLAIARRAVADARAAAHVPVPPLPVP